MGHTWTNIVVAICFLVSTLQASENEHLQCWFHTQGDVVDTPKGWTVDLTKSCLDDYVQQSQLQFEVEMKNDNILRVKVCPVVARFWSYIRPLYICCDWTT